MSHQAHYIAPGQLRPGLYIHLDLGWMDHSFTFSSFKIKNEEQIEQIQALKLEKVRYDPRRSDLEPLPLAVAAATPAEITVPQVLNEPSEVVVDVQQQRLDALHRAVYECEKKFSQAANEAKRIEREIFNNPPKNLAAARALVDGLVDSLLAEGDVALHAMQQKPGAAENHVRSLNTLVLTLILAKSLDLSSDDAKHLGLGCFLHDVGMLQIPSRITQKTEALTKAELSLIQQHPALGTKFGMEQKLDTSVLKIIQQHHECSDGSGYPLQLKQEQINSLARIAAIAIAYEELCNPVNIVQAMTPYEALAHMFVRLRSKFDEDILKVLIKCLGIYPPGSIVQLSDNRYGIVVSVNPSKPLRPYVLLYAPEVPIAKPLLINLGDELGVSISRCLRQDQLPKDVLTYLAPGRRICYFFNHEESEPEALPI
ncbi:MAG: DUF3391 domain-containing protein [Methylophilaceae bacterium]|nr:DUF3391 domain-containing protein [Methylophilaceae bacterium]